jgi:hypothetical protein
MRYYKKYNPTREITLNYLYQILTVVHNMNIPVKIHHTYVQIMCTES